MRTLNKEEFNIYEQELLTHLKTGKLFIYPTDTIYGLGCDATNEEAVQKIRDAKERQDSPFSIVAPSKEWIREHCEVKEKDLQALPGAVTVILKKKKECVANNVSFNDTLGVRIPDHWSSNIAKKLGRPIITTSVNKQGQQYAKTIDDVHAHIKGKVHFAINEGVKTGRPSTIINTLTKEQRKR
tara:strand:+ start:253 stop:804 length:552 start_codon:yes stop_codon:yes gene_type:complete